MKIELNNYYLITTDSWFFAPDGNQYLAVFGLVTSIDNDEETLGIKTNRGSSNWYVTIGNLCVAGCQIHYAIKTKSVKFSPYVRTLEYKGDIKHVEEKISRIYDARVEVISK